MGKTVAMIDQELQSLKRTSGNMKVAGGTVWNVKQLGEVIAEHDKHNEIIKVEISHSFESKKGKSGYNYHIYFYSGFEDFREDQE